MVAYADTPPFSLTIAGGGENGERFVFEQKEVTLGRIADNDLVLYDASVSRRHSMIYYRNGQFILEDLGSSNGTVLNGYLINQPTVLCEGDHIVIGAVRFAFSTMVFGEDSDAATEIEGWLPQTADEIPLFNKPADAPLVAIPRNMAGQGVPVPYEGSTQAFSAERLQEVLQPQPNGSRGVGYPEVAYSGSPLKPPPIPGPTGQNWQAVSGNPGAGLGSGLGGPQAGGVHAYVEVPPQRSLGVSSNPQLPGFPSSASMPGMNAASGASFRENSRMPSSPDWSVPARQPGGIPQPSRSVPPPNLPPPMGSSASSASRDQLKQHPMMVAQEQQNQRKSAQIQHHQLVQLTLWSGVLFLLSAAFFFIPSRSATSHPEQDKEIFLSTNTKESEAIFGYNKHDRNHPQRITFQFSYRNGRMWIAYRILSGVPVDIVLNGNTFFTVPPSPKEWVYHRHEFPRNMLQLNRFNLVTFKRAEKNTDNPLWGLTHLHLREQSLPNPDLDKAKVSCQTGYQWYQQREMQPGLRYRAMIAFSECMDYLALMTEVPPLYKQAEDMVTRINQELDTIYQQQLQQAHQEIEPNKRIQRYEQLLKYFSTDTTDARHQRVQQLLQQQRKSSGNENR